MKSKQPSRKTGNKAVRRKAAPKRRGTAGSQPVRRTRPDLKTTPKTSRSSKVATRKVAKSPRTKSVRQSPTKLKRPDQPAVRKTAKSKSSSPRASKPAKRGRAARVIARPRIRLTQQPKPTRGTVPPFFPGLDDAEETPRETAPTFVVRDGERIEVPAILLEIEHPPTSANPGEGRLHVTARDPHWLYVHWDLTREHQAKLNAQSTHGHLIVRVLVGSLQSEPVSENHVHPQSRHWFAHVDTAGAIYFAQLGFYENQQWRGIATAGPVSTPHRRVSADTSATFITIHQDDPLTARPWIDAASSNAGSPTGGFSLSDGPAEFPTDWTPAQQLAVLKALGLIRGGETISGDSDAGEIGSSELYSFEIESESSRCDAFGKSPCIGNNPEEFTTLGSSSDVPWLSPADIVELAS